MIDRICVVAVGYNRPKSMGRLLSSLEHGDYCGDKVDLLISIDKGERQNEIKELAEDFCWKYGDKIVRAFIERQGLRKHILQCGDMTEEYRAVVILEDDITVSENFYSYVKQTISFYQNDDRIAGVSLYKHYVNVGVNHFFEPEYIGYDVFFMQFAQSWGQCWTAPMWNGFKTWYLLNEDYFVNDKHDYKNIPGNILHWGKQSWMKYFMAYLAETHKYFVYPYHSLSTNHSEVGEHNNTANADWQVSMMRKNMEYRLSHLDDGVRYDIFFERENYVVRGYENKKCILDLYGNKKDFSNGDILVSTATRPNKVLEKRRLQYRPHELNCAYGQAGDGIFIYDLHETDEGKSRKNKSIRTKYDTRAIEWKELISLGVNQLYAKIRKKLYKK